MHAHTCTYKHTHVHTHAHILTAVNAHPLTYSLADSPGAVGPSAGWGTVLRPRGAQPIILTELCPFYVIPKVLELEPGCQASTPAPPSNPSENPSPLPCTCVQSVRLGWDTYGFNVPPHTHTGYIIMTTVYPGNQSLWGRSQRL